MEVKYATIATKQEEENKVLVKHICVWESAPEEEDIKGLVKELWERPEWDMVGDDDYDLVNLERSEENEHIFEQLNIPKELTEQKQEAEEVVTPKKKATPKKKSKK
jgi:pimeloyl-CoA synthetase